MNTSGFDLKFVGIGEIEFPIYSHTTWLEQEVPFAIFISIFCTFCIILQFLVMRAMITDKELRRLPAFQIMFLISVFDTVQLFVHLTAVYYILDSRPHFNTIDFLIGAVMNASWATMLILSILLNTNRVISIVFHISSGMIFGKLQMGIYLGICMLFWFIIFLVNALGLSRMVYLLPTYTWHYAAANPLSPMVRTISADISLVDVLFSLVCHTIIFAYIYLKAAILSKKEFILSTQVLCISVFHVFGYVVWEYAPIPWEAPIGLFFGHFIWMMWNSINPILYILINPRIRNLVLASVGKKQENSHRSLFRPSNVAVSK